MTKENMEKIADKIRKLLALAANNANEAEAMAAAEKARSLMDEYNVTVSLEDGEQPDKADRIDTDTVFSQTDKMYMYIASAVAYFTDSVAVYTKAGKSKHMTIFLSVGLDGPFAKHLYEMLVATLKREVEAFRKSRIYAIATTTEHGRTVIHSFKVGFVNRISKRLREIKDASKAAMTSSGNDLIVSKQALIEDLASTMGLQSMNYRPSAGSVTGMKAGAAAGDKAQFNRPVAPDGQAQKMLG